MSPLQIATFLGFVTLCATTFADGNFQPPGYNVVGLAVPATAARYRTGAERPTPLNPGANSLAQVVGRQVDKVNPWRKFLHTYVKELEPLQDFVLIGFLADDNGQLAWNRPGVVVACGPSTRSQQVSPGALVAADLAACNADSPAENFPATNPTQFTAASWTTAFSSTLATGQNGLNINGADLNTNDGWGFAQAPENVAGGAPFNLNVQPRFMLCREGSILGVYSTGANVIDQDRSFNSLLQGNQS